VHNAESFMKEQMVNGEVSLEAKQKVATILNG
jgi:hypothetical protein